MLMNIPENDADNEPVRNPSIVADRQKVSSSAHSRLKKIKSRLAGRRMYPLWKSIIAYLLNAFGGDLGS